MTNGRYGSSITTIWWLWQHGSVQTVPVQLPLVTQIMWLSSIWALQTYANRTKLFPRMYKSNVGWIRPTMSLSKQLQLELHHLLLKGKSYTTISKQLSISHSTISKYCKRLNIILIPNKGGRPTKISAKDQHWLVHSIMSGHVDTASEAKCLLGLNVSNQTVCNALWAGGLRAQVKVKKPTLKLIHQRHHLNFAIAHQHWTLKDWSHVIFLHETKIDCMGSDGRCYCYKMPGEELSKRTVQPTVKHGGGSTMVWGAMTMQGVGRMCVISGIMDAQKYVKILDQNLLATACDHWMHHTSFIFQQDGDPKHTSATAQDWFQGNQIDVLEWPSQSPDLNPIKHLWGHLKWRLNSYENHPTSIYELECWIEKEWNSIDPEVCQKLIASMPERPEAVIRAKGGNTKY